MTSVPGFTPSTSAPLFGNGPWPPGLDLRLALAGLPAVSVDVTSMGLCGGMAFLARDVHEAGGPQLRGTDSRALPLALGRHLVRRQVDSFLGPGVVSRWIGATAGLDHATWFWGPGLFADTVSAARAVMATVDDGLLCPVGVVLAQSQWPWGVFANHVELVYGYEVEGSHLTLRVYDPNLPGRDDLTISLDIGTRAPAKPVFTNATCVAGRPGRIRGFFALPYQPQDPTSAYVDDAQVELGPLEESPDGSAAITVTVVNNGSTTLDPDLGYRLGTADPHDDASWGASRFELAGRLDPGQRRTQTLQVAVPGPHGRPLRLQPLREGMHWFGRPSAAVGPPTRLVHDEVDRLTLTP